MTAPELQHASPPFVVPKRRRVLLFGATGTIGQATARALVCAGHDVVCVVRPGRPGRPGASGGVPGDLAAVSHRLGGAAVRWGVVTDPASIRRDGFAGETFDTVVSCLASRKGAPRDAWAVDFQAHADLLAVAKESGSRQFVLLSAICVQKPRLAFQQAKLAFEKKLMASDLTYSIVRPTAYFKSLSGQIGRVASGKPYLLFGDGTLTATKPISDDDLATFIAECLVDASRQNCVLPIGGPGVAITPREQGEELFRLLGKPAKFRQLPPAMLDAVVWGLATLGRVSAPLADKAEFARIGRYYATESMLVLDPVTGRYDAAATPSTGTETLFDYYARVVAGEAPSARGDHAVF